MVKGETYSNQLFENEAFRHFINTFLNAESGITKGCELTQTSSTISIDEGYFVILGGLLREKTGTTLNLPTEAGYYKLVYEIDLSKINTSQEFNQGSYKFIKSLGDYPSLTQEDLDDDGTVYQFEFCQFRITESGITDYVDKRTFLDFDNIYEEIREHIEAIDDGSAFVTKTEASYSTSEVNTGKTWIDGKPIYRKVVTQTVSNFRNTIDIGLGTTDVDIFINGRVLINTGSFTAINHTATSTSYNMARWVFNKNTNKVQVYNNLEGGITGTIYVILEYTKTTD